MHAVVPSPAAPPPTPRTGRLAVLAAVTTLLAGILTVTQALPAAAAASSLVNAATGECLDVQGRLTAPGTPVGSFRCLGQSNQSWEATATGELRVYPDAPLCLDATAKGSTAGTLLQVWTCNGGTNQQWQVNPDGTLTGVQSGLCVSAAAGAVAQLAACGTGTALRWARPGADTLAPTPPSDPLTTDLTCAAVHLSWTAASDDVGVAFYDIYHDGQLMTSVPGSTLSVDLTVVAGATWGLYVNARDAVGNVSQASATSTIRVPQCQADTEAPTAPNTLAGVAFGTSVTLTWRAATDNVAVAGYDIFRNDVKAGAVTGSVTTFLDGGLAGDTAYRYRVVARDAQANVSTNSNTVTVTTAAACTTPVCAVRQLGTDTDIPWGLTTLPDGSILYSRRDAQDIVRLDPVTGAKTTVGRVPNVQSTDGEGGLMGLAIASTFSTDRWLYIMHTSPTDNRVLRMKLTTANTLDTGSSQILLSGILRNKFHNGGRLRFGPDGKLYISTGDGQNENTPQDRNSLNGKILRINPDGSIPSDNPFGNRTWSYGHRNPQGLAFDSAGRLWEQEFGNTVMDETNLITKGGNYGWPACEGTSGNCNQAGFIAPKLTYTTANGSCSGITVVRTALYIACERGERLYRSVINGNLATPTQHFVGTFGRLRTVEPAPDGGLWLSTSTIGDKDSVPNNSNEKLMHVDLGP